VELFAAQAVALAFHGEDFGVVEEPIDHGGGGHVVAEDLSQALNGLLEVTIIEARSVAVRDKAEHEVGGFGVKLDYPTSSTTIKGMNDRRHVWAARPMARAVNGHVPNRVPNPAILRRPKLL
jgi:hypothetical protein